MTKTRVHELAAEFGVESEQLIGLAADMGIHVRSHLSAFDSDQVALIRARWERDKRRKPEAEKKKVRRRRGAAAETKPEVKKPARRRRAAAEVAARAAAEAEKQAEEQPVVPAQETLQVFLDERPVTAEAGVFITDAGAVEVLEPAVEEREDSGTQESTADEAAESPAAQQAEEEVVGDGVGQPEPFIPNRIPRPPVSIRPVASAAPRPIASAAPGDAAEERRREKKKQRKRGKKTQVDHAAVKANINRTLASLKTGKSKRKRRDDEPSFRELEEQRRTEEKEREKTLVRVNEFITVSELSDTLNVSPTDIVSFCFKQLGMMVTVNQRLDFDQIELIAGEFGFEAVKEEEYAPEAETVEVAEEDVEARPPVVTVMGHVDHGKTSLLDYIRKTNVIEGESGGITQHIGAYHVEWSDGRVVTFLDTPGHEAFTAMRARGAQSTDIVVLVIAADDQVMPQTVEGISHARTAGVPIVVAINKIDLPAANVEKVKHDLLQHEVVLEEFGGDVLSSAISAKTGEGIDDLFNKILLQAEILDLKAVKQGAARGTVVESMLDPGKGPIATVLVQSGTLREGDNFLCGNLNGRVRAMFDERGHKIAETGPSMPAQILGFEGVPYAGDSFQVVATAQEARDTAQKRQRLDREAGHRRSARGVSLEELSRRIGEGETQTLNVIIKADQAGPAEALADAFARLSTDEVRVDVIHRGVGAVSESDVVLAKASNAMVVGFHVRADANARQVAERERVEVKTYRVIYEAVDEIRLALEGLLAPEEREVVLGEAEVLKTFKISGTGTIAGCVVRNGIMQRAASLRLIRDGVEVYEGTFASLKRFQEDVKEVREGLECGIGFTNYNDIKVGDILEAFQVEEIARTLETAEAGGE